VTVGGEASSLVGVLFDVPITVDLSARSDLLGSFALTMRWNPAVLELIGGREGDFGEITVNEDSLPTGVLFASGAKPGGQGGRVVVAVGRFRPLVAAADTFRLTVSELYAAQTFVDLLADVTASDRPYCPALGRYGDMNDDGAVGSYDALLALSVAVGSVTIPPGTNVAMGDVHDGNGNATVGEIGDVGATDALVMLSHAVGLDVISFRVMQMAAGACGGAIPPLLTVDPGNVTVVPGQEIQFAALATDAGGNPLAVSDVFWRTSDDRVIAVGPSGVALAVDTGIATVTATRTGGASATATVTVVRQRGVVWVDAAALGSPNQLGDASRPYATIQQGVEAAQGGDTVRVRAGTYAESVNIRRSVVVEGDTSVGGIRPFLTDPGGESSVFVVDGGGRVELSSFRTDTVYRAVTVNSADTVWLRNLEVRTRVSGAASVGVDQVGALRVERSRFFGPADAYYTTNAILVSSGAGLVRVDSSLITGYGDHALDLTGVDSLELNANVIRDNYGWGVYLCNRCGTADTAASVAAVIRGNRFAGNYYGQVSLGNYRRARFERNVIVGGGYYYYDGIALTGHDGSVASFLADSFDVRDAAWLDARDFDSLLVDSVDIAARDDYGYLEDGRIAVIRHTRFRELTSAAFELYASTLDSVHLRLLDVDFSGPDSATCDRCGSGVWAYGPGTIQADSVTGFNLDQAFDLNDTHLTLTNSSVTDAYYGAYADCGSIVTSNVAMTDVRYPVYHYGCATTDSVVVTGARFERGYTAVNVDDVVARIENSTIRDFQYGADLYCTRAIVRDDSLVNAGYGVYAYGGCATTDSLLVDGITVVGSSSYGVYANSMDLTRIVGSRLVGSQNPIYVNYGRTVVSDDTVSASTGTGVYLYSAGSGTITAERNAVSCAAAAADGMYLYTTGGDSAVARDNTVSGCRYTGIELYARRFVEARGNTVVNPTPYADYGIDARSDTVASVVGNVISGPARYGSMIVRNTRRAAVDSNTVTGSIGAGVYAYYVDSVAIRGNTVSGHDTLAGGAIGVQPGGIVLYHSTNSGPGVATIAGNRVTGSGTAGIVVQRDYPTDTVTVQVDSNAVRGATTAGIRISGYAPVVVTRNAVDSTANDGIYVDRVPNDSATIRINFNNITRNAVLGVRNQDAIRLDATNNYWGDPSGPACDTCFAGLGDSLVTLGTNTIVYDPWLLTAYGQAPVPAPPAFAVVTPPVVLMSADAAGRPSAPLLSRAVVSPSRRAAMPPPGRADDPERQAREAERRARREGRERLDAQRAAQRATLEAEADAQRQAHEAERKGRRP
jgi:hypothetical protein